MMAILAAQAAREKLRKAEIQDGADRARFLMKQGALDGCRWLQERCYGADGTAPVVVGLRASEPISEPLDAIGALAKRLGVK